MSYQTERKKLPTHLHTICSRPREVATWPPCNGMDIMSWSAKTGLEMNEVRKFQTIISRNSWRARRHRCVEVRVGMRVHISSWLPFCICTMNIINAYTHLFGFKTSSGLLPSYSSIISDSMCNFYSWLITVLISFVPVRRVTVSLNEFFLPYFTCEKVNFCTHVLVWLCLVWLIQV